MNEPDFERQLRTLHPAAPPRALEDHIAQDLAPAPAAALMDVRKPSWLDRLLPGLGWSALGASAAVVAMLALNLTRENPTMPTLDLPARLAAAAEADVELEQQLLEVADEGIVEVSSEGPVRQMRYHSLERRQWKGDDGAVTVVEVPREDVVRVPVSIQ
jgi:hypothetical protein